MWQLWSQPSWIMTLNREEVHKKKDVFYILPFLKLRRWDKITSCCWELLPHKLPITLWKRQKWKDYRFEIYDLITQLIKTNTNKQKEQKRRCIFESFECQSRKNGEFLSKPLETGYKFEVQRATFWADFPSNLLLSRKCRLPR